MYIKKDHSLNRKQLNYKNLDVIQNCKVTLSKNHPVLV